MKSHSTADKSTELPVVLFESQDDWDAWLDGNHETSGGVWLRIAKTGSGLRSVTYAQALESALIHGWIDGQKKKCDDVSWLQKFTRRGARSVWSKINREKVEGLTASGRMKPAGLRAVEVARSNGQWDAAYDSQSKSTPPDDLLRALAKNKRAMAEFEKLNGANRFAILFRIQTAKKPETRARRIEQFVEMLARGERLYP